MLTIGEMSRLCRISTKTLRHYHKINLVKPTYINEENGYRYYSAEQSNIILFINKMKLYYFTLEDISQLIKLSSTDLYPILHKKLFELEEDLVKQNYIISDVKNSLSLLERGFSIMNSEYPITVLETENINVVSIVKEMGIKDFEKAYEDLFEIIEKNNYIITGPSFALYHSEDFDPDNTEIEVCFPIHQTSGENTKTIYGTLCCHTFSVGPYIDFSPAYIALQKWIEKNNYEITDSPLEVYTKGVDSKLPPEQYITDIYFPIKRIDS